MGRNSGGVINKGKVWTQKSMNEAYKKNARKINDRYEQELTKLEAKSWELFYRFQDMVKKEGLSSFNSNELIPTDSQQKWYDRERGKLKIKEADLNKAREDALKKNLKKWNAMAKKYGLK